MTVIGLVVGVLAGATVWSFRAAWAATTAARVRGRLAIGDEPAPRCVRPALPQPPPALAAALGRAGLGPPAATVWHAWLAGTGVATVAALVIGGLPLGAVVVTALVVGPAAMLRSAAGRGDRLLEGGVPVLLERIARSLRAGGTLTQALRESAADAGGELGHDLRTILRETSAGEPLVDALDRWAVRRPLPTVRLTVAALAVGAETGGAQAQALDGLAATLRDRLAVASEVRALSSQARLSALVISLAPIGFAVFAAATDPRSADFLLRTPVGIACLCAGLALDGVAAWWMARLTRTPT